MSVGAGTGRATATATATATIEASAVAVAGVRIDDVRSFNSKSSYQGSDRERDSDRDRDRECRTAEFVHWSRVQLPGLYFIFYHSSKHREILNTTFNDVDLRTVGHADETERNLNISWFQVGSTNSVLAQY